MNIASNANVFLKQPDCKLPLPPNFKEFNIKMIPICTVFVCPLFMERENSFWAKLPLKIEIFLYCNKIFPLKGVFEDRQIPIENQEMRGLFFETPLPF